MKKRQNNNIIILETCSAYKNPKVHYTTNEQKIRTLAHLKFLEDR